MGKVKITGTMTQKALAELYREADLFILPLLSKIHWGIPNVVIEAMATKTPVICSSLPSLHELMEHGKSGWFIPERKPKAIVWAIQHLWADPILRLHMGEAGYQKVSERFSLEVTGKQLREIFQVAMPEVGLVRGKFHEKVLV